MLVTTDDLMDLGLNERQARMVADRCQRNEGLHSLARMKGASVRTLNDPPGVDEPELQVRYVDLAGRGPTLCRVNGDYLIGDPEDLVEQIRTDLTVRLMELEPV